MSELTIARAREGDLGEILRDYERFWGDNTLPRYLHHPMFVYEFGDTAFVARRADGQIAGYLLGFVAPTGDGYIHMVAVRTMPAGSDWRASCTRSLPPRRASAAQQA